MPRKIRYAALILLLLVMVAPAQAQEPLPQDLIRQARFDQKLNNQIPLELTFTNSEGQPVQLSHYFGDKPVILNLGYYECPMLCSLSRNGLFESLQDLNFTVGEEFEVLIVSIDPDETPDIAKAKKRATIMEYGRSGEGWHFLVGDEEAIRPLAEAVGFHYVYDEKIDEYVHPSGIIILTPEGRISRYLFGIEYPPRDVRLGLVEATADKIGSPVDQVLLVCYHYDPVSGEYTLAIMTIIRILAVVTVAGLGAFVAVMFRRERAKS